MLVAAIASAIAALFLPTRTLGVESGAPKAKASADGGAGESPGLCHPDERVAFSCHLPTKRKVVALCTAGPPGQLNYVAYRYGIPGKVENEYIARRETTDRFFGTELPHNPKALVTMVWFNRRGVSYVVTECVGGDCKARGGLAVVRGTKVVLSGACALDGPGDKDSFGRDLLEWKPDPNLGSKTLSATELLTFDEDDAPNSPDEVMDAIYGKSTHLY